MSPYQNLQIFMFITSLMVSSQCLKFSSVDLAYKKGFDAYSGERWSECIVQFEESLHLYKLYKTIIINCRLKCSSHEYDSEINENIEDLKIYEKFFKARDCLTKCQEKGFEDLHMYSDLHETVMSNMQMRKPYEYLHICYFQMYALPKAASAAYTYLIANPNDEQMRNNLDYYSQQPEVNINEVVDLENEEYNILYKLGLKSYNLHNWGETVAALEEALADYLTWENNCRVECERQPEQEWSPEFVITTSNMIAALLQCRQQCQSELKSLDYNSGSEYLADILNYLQISYYHLSRFEDAAKAVSSYLALMPKDEDMLENKNIYSTLVDKEMFIERSDIIYYLKRDTYEKKLLAFFHQGNNYSNNSNAI